MGRIAAALFVVAAVACATERAAETPIAPQGQATVLKAAELARVRCLLVAPFENGSDAPLAAEAATGAVLSGIDAARTVVFPVPELRGIFHDTPLDLPQGLSPSLALELGELVGADAALWGSIEGRGRDGGELLITIRLSLVGDHQLLFADTALVRLAPGDKPENAIRGAVLEVTRPMLARLGDAGRRRCFDAERIRSLRRFALAGVPEPKATGSAADSTATPAAKLAPGAARDAPATAATTAAGAEPRTPRQADWAKRLAAGGRVLVEDVSFSGRSADLQRDGGLADLATALLAQPGLAVRIEGFVDATADRAADAKLSSAMAQAAARRLAEHGVPRQRITAAGRGGESPILPNFTARGRTANRRIEAVAAL
jgi:outer membrane protein OmpA-like peptidoglycan-associated protein